MKAFKTFLKEDEEFAEIINKIVNDCEPFLKEIDIEDDADAQRHFLYRGMGSLNEMFVKKDVRKNRTPKDTPQKVHEIMDQSFNDIWGHRFRSNAMFCNGNTMEAELYGNVYMVFPIGNFDYVFSEEIEDFYKDLDQVLFDEIMDNYSINDLGGPFNKMMMVKFIQSGMDYEKFPEFPLNEDQMKELFDRVIKSKYTNDNLDKYVKGNQISTHEVMIACDSYYAVNLDYAEMYDFTVELADAYLF